MNHYEPKNKESLGKLLKSSRIASAILVSRPNGLNLEPHK